MDKETILIIVGAIFILAAVSSALKLKDFEYQLAYNKARIPLAVLGIGLLLLGIIFDSGHNFEDKRDLEDRKEEPLFLRTAITYPLENEEVNCTESARGVHPKNLEDDIWVVIKPEDNRYYPQADRFHSARKTGDGEWKVFLRFGGSKGEIYELIVYETDKTASNVFSETLKNWFGKKEYPGLEEYQIPKGAKKVSSILVKSKYDCQVKH